MKSLLLRFFLSIAFVAIGGCAAMPARQSLGLDRMEKDEGVERLATCFLLVELPHRNEVKGFELQMTEALMRAGLVGVPKELTNFNGESIQLIRKAFQGIDTEGKAISVYLSSGKSYVFSNREVRIVKVFSPEGKPYEIKPIRALSEAEIDALYAGIELEFPKTSPPIEGSNIRFHYGPEAILSLTIPQTVTFWERGAITGLGSVVLNPNPYAIAFSKVIAYIRTRVMSPTAGTLAEAPAIATVTETSLFLGGDR